MIPNSILNTPTISGEADSEPPTTQEPADGEDSYKPTTTELLPAQSQESIESLSHVFELEMTEPAAYMEISVNSLTPTESAEHDLSTNSDVQTSRNADSLTQTEPAVQPQRSQISLSANKLSEYPISGESDNESFMTPDSMSDTESLDSIISEGSDSELYTPAVSLHKREGTGQTLSGQLPDELRTSTEHLPQRPTRNTRKRNAVINTEQLEQTISKVPKTLPPISNLKYNLRERPEQDDCGSEEPLSDEEHRIVYVLWENIFTKNSPDFDGKRSKNSWGFWFSCVYHETIEKYFKPDYVSDISKIDYDTLTDGDNKYFYIDMIHESDLFEPGHTPSDMFRLGQPREKAVPSVLLLTKDFYIPCFEPEATKSRRNFKNQKSGFHSEKGVAWRGRSFKLMRDGISPEQILKPIMNSSFIERGYFEDLMTLLRQKRFKNITTEY